MSGGLNYDQVMDFQESKKSGLFYQEQSRGFVIDSVVDPTVKHCNRAMKIETIIKDLGDETDELIEKLEILKEIHTRGLPMPDNIRQGIIGEIGDVLFNLARTCDFIGVNLDNMMLRNLNKLADRKSRGVILGEGDNR